MKTTFRLAAAAASLLLATGCTSSLRSKDRTMREPVQLPGVPHWERLPRIHPSLAPRDRMRRNTRWFLRPGQWAQTEQKPKDKRGRRKPGSGVDHLPKVVRNLSISLACADAYAQVDE